MRRVYTRSEAWSRCTTRAAQFDAQAAAQNPPAKTGYWCKEYLNSPTSGAVYVMSPPPGSGEMGIYWAWAGTCPNGGRWDSTTNTCGPSEEECKAKPPLGPTFTAGSMSPSTCVGGCQFVAQGGSCISTNGSSACAVSGATATGATCGVGDVPPTPDKPQECVPSAAGNVCIKPDGQECYTAGSGRQTCWQRGETGEKDDQNVKQKRDAGNEPIPPNLQLPSGDNLSPQGPPVQTVTQTNNQTIVTVTQNYGTQHGTNAGSGPNKGESASGDGTGKDGDGKGSASGGGNCETPPVTTGDPVLGMVATQAWATRCAVEAGNAAKVTGDVANCAQPFTVEGTNANAVKLRAMRAQLCNGDKNGNNRPDWTETNGTETPEPGEGEDEPGLIGKVINTDLLDTDGFLGGSASCPQMGTVDLVFTQVDLSNAAWWCPFVAMCRAILLLMGAYIALRLLME